MNDIQRALLQALAELAAHKPRPWVKTVFILQRALENAGLLTEGRRTSLYDQMTPTLQDALAAKYYAELIALIRESDPEKVSIIGQGNFGDPDDDDPPALPLFTECRLSVTAAQRFAIPLNRSTNL